MSHSFLKNVWYMAGWAHELEAGVVARTVAGIPILVVKPAQGAIYALHDRCPHRFAPLSRGRVNSLGIECGYHGLTFDPMGRCVANPLGGVAPAACKVQPYPVVVQDSMIWVWVGDPAQANPQSIVRFACFADTRWKFVFGVTNVAANYELMTDNLLDLTHAAYLHPAFGSHGHRPKVTMERKGDVVYSRYTLEDIPNSQFAEILWPTHGVNVDQWDDIRWNAPATHYLESGATRTGRPRAEGFMIPAAHILTPQSTSHTTYFWASGMPPNCPLSEQQFESDLRHVFETEDLPMIEAVQSRMAGAEFWSLQPVLLKNDSATVIARRILAEKIAAELQAST